MKKLLSVIAISVAALAADTAAGQSSSGSVQGVWQAVEVTFPGTSPRTIKIPEPRPNLTIITARHYGRVQVDSEEPRPVPTDIAKSTADELRAVWGPFVGEACTAQTSEGHVITMHPIVAKNPAAMKSGAFTTWSYRRDGNTMRLTATANQNGPVDPVTVTVIRVASKEDASGMVMTRNRPASLLIVLAHPDDEIFHGGVLTHLSRPGVRVTLVCATNGEAGRPHPSVGPVTTWARCGWRSLGCRASVSASTPRCSFASTIRGVASASGMTIHVPSPTST